MKFIVSSGEREEAVEIDRTVTGYRVRVGETDYEIDQVRLGPGHRSLIYDGSQHEVALRELADDRYLVSSSRGQSEVQVLDPLAHLAAQTRGDGASAAGSQVHAYMPGRVVTLMVEDGQTVAPGQPLLVLEAMKMENEIACEVEGVVQRIAVEAGQAVEGGDLMIEIEVASG